MGGMGGWVGGCGYNSIVLLPLARIRRVDVASFDQPKLMDRWQMIVKWGHVVTFRSFHLSRL